MFDYLHERNVYGLNIALLVPGPQFCGRRGFLLRMRYIGKYSVTPGTLPHYPKL